MKASNMFQCTVAVWFSFIHYTSLYLILISCS